MEKEFQVLTEGLEELGLDHTKKTIGLFEIYLRELKKWNKTYNLTAISDDGEIVTKHFLDSLLYLKAIPEASATICDVGSGGGFPGIPIAIVRPELLVTLLEPSRKKIAFLRQMRRLLSLKNVEVLNFRAEEIVESQFDIVVTRATFSIVDFIKKAGHLAGGNGILIMNKGPKYEDEMKALPPVLKADVISVSLPRTGIERKLLVISV